MTDADATALRMDAISKTKTLPVTEEAIRFAELLLRETVVPRTSFDDALHIAVAAINKMDFLVTWNCKHIANAVTMPKIYKVCQDAGYSCPLICTPEQMKGERVMEVHSDIMEELWKIKEEIASQYKTFREFAEDMLKYQAERHPELTTALAVD